MAALSNRPLVSAAPVIPTAFQRGSLSNALSAPQSNEYLPARRGLSGQKGERAGLPMPGTVYFYWASAIAVVLVGAVTPTRIGTTRTAPSAARNSSANSPRNAGPSCQ